MLKHSGLKRQVNQAEEVAQLKGEMVKGRQIRLMIIEWYKFVEADGYIFDFAHLQAVKMRDQDLRGFIDE